MKISKLFEDTFLIESVDYNTILKPLYDAFDEIKRKYKTPTSYNNVLSAQDELNIILNDIKNLPRSDLKINCLLWVRAVFIHQILFEIDPSFQYPLDSEILENARNVFLNYVKKSYLKDLPYADGKAKDFLHHINSSNYPKEVALNMVNNMLHFSGIPIKEIQKYRVEPYQNLMEISQYFTFLEDEWKKDSEGVVEYQGETKLLDFGDGYAWYDLGRGACSKEAEAMGHCGNQASVKPGDTIYSLRSEKDSKILKVHLTFIFNEQTGMFGEMKGRGNDKPATKYHKYIIPLLMMDHVKGIKGGGYMPESNFNIKDVANWESIVQQKPSLLEIGEYYDMFGYDNYVWSYAKKVLSKNENFYDIINENFVFTGFDFNDRYAFHCVYSIDGDIFDYILDGEEYALSKELYYMLVSLDESIPLTKNVLTAVNILQGEGYDIELSETFFNNIFWSVLYELENRMLKHYKERFMDIINIPDDEYFGLSMRGTGLYNNVPVSVFDVNLDKGTFSISVPGEVFNPADLEYIEFSGIYTKKLIFENTVERLSGSIMSVNEIASILRKELDFYLQKN